MTSSINKEETSVLSSFTSGLETFGKGVGKVVNDSEGLGLLAEFFQSIIPATKSDPGKAPPGSFTAKIETALTGFAGFLTIITFLADKVKWFIPDDKGKYLIDKSPVKKAEQLMWEVAHDIDLINWMRSVKIIDSDSPALNVLSSLGSALKGAIAALSFFMSIRAIDRAVTKITNYDISKHRWQARQDLSVEGWAYLSSQKVREWTLKRDTLLFKNYPEMRSLAEIQATLDYEAALAKSNPELADKLLKLTGKMSDSDKKKLLHYEGKMKLWTGIGKEAQKVMGRPDAECSTHFISALKAWSSKKHENCKTGIENQNKKIVRNAVSMVLCAAIVASVAITIALQASSSGGLWGLPSHSAPFLALSIGTSVLYLTEFVVRIHFDKKKMRAEAPNFHHHHGPAACDRRDLHAHRYSIV